MAGAIAGGIVALLMGAVLDALDVQRRAVPVPQAERVVYVKRSGVGMFGCFAQLILLVMLGLSFLFFWPAIPFIIIAMILVAIF